ncbi:hypothetical protein QCA50_013479 [Cerrena zonata]|uniref:Uncharacterized protein n=1 Tax=Cerrena zonata TaxID=2478898 RepID=A0AAW0G1X9_9APHY
MLSRIIFVLFVALSAVFVQAAPLATRQIGNLQCNLDRIKIVSDLAQAKKTTQTLTTQLGSDPAGSQGISAVSDGLSNAQAGIATIAKSLFTGQAAPADARQQVADGLTAAGTALASINSTDPTVTSNLDKLQTQLTSAGTAGEGVVSNCK